MENCNYIFTEEGIRMSFNEFAGVYTLLLTPFNEDLTVDYKAYEEYVSWQASFSPQHLFAVCGSSEMTSLTREERIKCASLAVKNSNGIPVFATANLEADRKNELEEIKALTINNTFPVSWSI